ncbi:MAG: family 10 glycosylhydrolase [Syntrophothermus sp.]
MKTKIKILLLSMLCPFFLKAQENKHYTCYRTTAPVTIDGRMLEDDWQSAEWSDDFVDITGKNTLKPSLQTRIKLLWDDHYLYLFAELQEPDVWATLQQRDAVIFHDNDFEVFLDPEGNGENYAEIEINALGTVWDLMLTRAYLKGGKPITEWNLGNLKAAVHVDGTCNDPSAKDTSWTVEMAFPLDELMKSKSTTSFPGEGVQWRINFSRVEWKTRVQGNNYVKIKDPVSGKELPEQNWVWSPMKEINMHIPGRWGWLEFSESAVNSEEFLFKNDQQKNDFKIWLWMNGHSEWNDLKWDSVFTVFNSVGIHGILTGADGATLKKMLPLAARHGISVQKWMSVMMNNDTALIHHHPDWFVVSREGKSSIINPAYVGYYRFLCPSNPEVHQYLKNKILEYLTLNGLDGIHLDYIRYPDVILPQALWPVYNIIQDKEYPQYDYCYCNHCREKFMKAGYPDPMLMENPESSSEWKQFRYDQITEIVNELSEECHLHDKKITAAVFPGPGIARQLVRQDWNNWTLDEIMPMLYQSFYNENLDWIRTETAEGSAAVKIPLYSGLYVPSLHPRELRSAINKSIQGGASGISLFNFEALTPRHLQILQKLHSVK